MHRYILYTISVLCSVRQKGNQSSGNPLQFYQSMSQKMLRMAILKELQNFHIKILFCVIFLQIIFFYLHYCR
jgi:hypothetical protein